MVLDDYGSSKGYGYLNFESEEVAAQVIALGRSFAIDGTNVDIARFVGRSQRDAAPQDNLTNLFVKNIPESFDQVRSVEPAAVVPTLLQEDLKGLFANFGTITSSVVMRDQLTGASRKFGFVNFVRQEDADKVRLTSPFSIARMLLCMYAWS